MFRRRVLRLALWISLGLVGCARSVLIPSPSLEPAGQSLTALPSPTLVQTETPFPSATEAVFTQTPTSLPEITLCSPLEGFSLDQIPGLISNPFHPMPPGSDEPHAGIDLADRLPGSNVAVSGRKVKAVLDGDVAGAIQNRFPFGNALIIETKLGTLPVAWLEQLDLPTPGPTVQPRSLTCPPVQLPALDPNKRSLYLLYAHLQSQPELRTGNVVQCGQQLGEVGQSGNALNPHLHFEVRLGPAGMRFPVMAHYDNSATQEEMGYYCIWAVSGLFQVVDPLKLVEVK